MYEGVCRLCWPFFTKILLAMQIWLFSIIKEGVLKAIWPCVIERYDKCMVSKFNWCEWIRCYSTLSKISYQIPLYTFLKSLNSRFIKFNKMFMSALRICNSRFTTYKCDQSKARFVLFEILAFFCQIRKGLGDGIVSQLAEWNVCFDLSNKKWKNADNFPSNISTDFTFLKNQN